MYPLLMQNSVKSSAFVSLIDFNVFTSFVSAAPELCHGQTRLLFINSNCNLLIEYCIEKYTNAFNVSGKLLSIFFELVKITDRPLNKAYIQTEVQVIIENTRQTDVFSIITHRVNADTNISIN